MGALFLLLIGACTARQAEPAGPPDPVEQLAAVCRCHFEQERPIGACRGDFPRQGPVFLRHSCAVAQDPDDSQQTYCVYEAWLDGDRLGRVYGWREEGGPGASRPCGAARPAPPES